MLISEAESANQADALILRTREAVANHNGAPNDAVYATFEDFRRAQFGTGRLRKLYGPHGTWDFGSSIRNLMPRGKQSWGLEERIGENREGWWNRDGS